MHVEIRLEKGRGGPDRPRRAVVGGAKLPLYRLNTNKQQLNLNVTITNQT